jgi:hypothetical protein
MKCPNTYFPKLFMVLVKILEIMFPPFSEMQYSVSDLSIVSSVGNVPVQGAHVDSLSGTASQNLSFIYSLSDPTSVIFWNDIGNHRLGDPTRVHVPPGSVLFFGGNTVHSGADHHSETPHFRLHGYVDNIHVNHNYTNVNFTAVNTELYTVDYDALEL